MKTNFPFSDTVTMVNKKDEERKTRLFIDFRKLNQMTIADKYPFLRIEEIIDNLQGSEYFTTLDIELSFWHVRMKRTSIRPPLSPKMIIINGLSCLLVFGIPLLFFREQSIES